MKRLERCLKGCCYFAGGNKVTQHEYERLKLQHYGAMRTSNELLEYVIGCKQDFSDDDDISLQYRVRVNSKDEISQRIKMEECRGSWRREAQATALKEADEMRLEGEERERFLKRREGERYAELEQLGIENLRP